jgi:hypothetical protein
MAIIFYRELKDDVIITPPPEPTPTPTPEVPLIPMPEPTPTPTPTPMPPNLPAVPTNSPTPAPVPTLSPEKQRYFELLKEYETLQQELYKCYGIPIPPPRLAILLRGEEVDYEELNEKLTIEIRKLKQQIEQCKSRQQIPVPVAPEPPKPPEAPIQTPPSGGGATTPSPEPTPSPETPEPKKAGFPAWLLILGLALIILLPKQNKEQK